VFKFTRFIFLGGLALLAGCAGAPRDNSGVLVSEQNAHLIERPSEGFAPPPVVSSPPLTPIFRPTNDVPPALRTNVAIAPKTNAPPPAKPAHRPVPPTFTSLNNWAADYQLNPPTRLTGSPVVTYSISSRNGVCVLEIGSRDATWRGMSVHLGFAPEMIDGQIFVHGLDIIKTLSPLLVDAPSPVAPHRTIVLDPGHGGINGGTVSIAGRAEKEFTLDWARRLGALLSASGWTVYLTRTNDADVTLSNRVALAEARRADLFVSLHFNSSAPDHRQSGLETYCLTPTGMPSTLTRGYADPWADSYPNNTYDVENIQLAARLHGALLAKGGMEDRGIRRARFMGVLLGQRRPAVLIEGGYLSHAREAQKIDSGAYRQLLAEAVAEALR
jgi:N-acetylmuramoyl-L-alanine amidase